MTIAHQLFDSLWSFYQRELSVEGVSELDYVEQLTYLLFLKIDDERSMRGLNTVQVVPTSLGWKGLRHLTGEALERQYGYTLEQCGKTAGISPEDRAKAIIFRKAKGTIRNPAKLRALVSNEIGRRKWTELGPSTLGDLYRMLLHEASVNFNLESGQTLTPEPLVSAVIDCVRPAAEARVFDPACGTGQLLVAAYQAMERDAEARNRSGQHAEIAEGALTGYDFDERLCRFATMNVLLSFGRPFNAPPTIEERNTLAKSSDVKPTLIICNPPFKTQAPQPQGRTDLIVDSNSNPLNFLQHIATTLPNGAKAVVFVPDNVLFEGNSERTVRQWIFQHCTVHTLLRLPSGVFERGGARSNILFFDRREVRPDGRPATERVDIYDFRTGKHFQVARNPLKRSDLDDFVAWYHSDRSPDPRHPAVSLTYDQIASTYDFRLNILYRGGDPVTEIPDPRSMAMDIADQLEAAAKEFRGIATSFPEVPDLAETDD
ncbi:HsdM family class I SAM-dependent methyltransferase [Actinomadura harenae]|uniref:site-specific DNA-methyltransferase (adenine-specific) n=1 Tax=Actinomadura harenae TaxID=2483351 RepID=A0A3M2LQ43_9ACTN|nr:N-6 DNA methylase [Actinomadura harenae]RMI39442.1 hypothetical protein EBO15_29680 [Actinomadura harenae]